MSIISEITQCKGAFFFSPQQRKEKQKIHNQEDYRGSLEMENIGSKLI